MKKVLITGANSYICVNVEKCLSKCSDKYSIETIDMIDGSWKNKFFSTFNRYVS